MLTPLYITEVAPVDVRGGLGVVSQLAASVGLILSQSLGLDSVLGSEEQWPVLLALGGAVPGAIQVKNTYFSFLVTYCKLSLTVGTAAPDA